MANEIIIKKIQEEINAQLSNPEAFKSLVDITFKGLTPQLAKRAMMEAMMRGMKFVDFMQKNVYAIPYGQGYSLVTSIDYNRKIGMRSGVVGVSSPKYIDDGEGFPITCEITVKRKVEGVIGDFTNLVYFKEYYAGNKNPDGSIKKNKYGDVKPNLWDNKPRTMIAKVAEMGALRKACPEELSQAYIEEEFEKEGSNFVEEKIEAHQEAKVISYKQKMSECKTLEELKNVWANMPATLKAEKPVVDYKEELKNNLTK